MRTVHVTQALDDAEVDAWEGRMLDERHYDVLISDEDADVFKPDGTPLVRYRRAALDPRLSSEAWRILRRIRSAPSNRGIATVGYSKKRTRRDGKASATTALDQSVINDLASRGVSSAIIGAFERNPRFPYCRLTAFNMKSPGEFARCLPYFQQVDRVFASLMPDRHAAQMDCVRRTAQEWCVPGTSFTTVTVNRNWRTAVHKDAGDLRAGFGVMTVLDAGKYTGGYLVFPKYRVAVDMRAPGLCCADVHEWHGNTAIVGHGAWERVSCVFYYRERMEACLTAEEELQRAQNRKLGEPMFDE